MAKKVVIVCDRIIEYSLYFLIFFLPFAKAASQFFTWFAIFVWLIKKIAGKNEKINITLPKNFNIFILLFVISCIISTILSYDFLLSLKALLTKAGKHLSIFFIVVETINNNKRFRNILFVLVMSAVLIMADGGVQYFKGKDFLRGYEKQGDRIQASFSTPVGFSGWLITIIPIVLLLIFSKTFFKKRIYKIGLFLLLFFLIICLGLTYSRSAWMGFILSFILLFYFIQKPLINKTKAFAYVLFILILFITIACLPGPIKERLFSIPEMGGNIPLRVKLTKDCLKIINDFPIFGVGLNNYSRVIVFYKSIRDSLYAHNSYLQMASETGIFGLLSFLGIVWIIFKLGSKTIYKTSDNLLLGLLASLTAFLTQSFFDVNLYALQLATLFWFVLGLSVARINILTQNTNNLT